ncbi:MAG: hypothetical protein JSW49_10705 [candidate division WOR-3 bacterium]|nr:MAG: hypothetical protein JSW49_10705 [candidate division WOR-3 bacterium]
MNRHRIRRKQAGDCGDINGKNGFAGILTKNKEQCVLRSEETKMKHSGMAWDCSVLCLSRCGPRIYAGPL